MHDSSQTPQLDRLRPRVLEALRVYGWRTEPQQVDRTFTVRGRRTFMGKEYAARVEFREGAEAVLYVTSGDGAVVMERDLRAEGVIS